MSEPDARTTAACGHEGGSHIRDLPGPDQGVWRLGQVQEPGYLGEIRGGTTGNTDAAGVLEQIHNGGKGGRALRDQIQGKEERDTGRPNVTHHLQCGGGCGGPPLGHSSSGGGRDTGYRGREGRHQAALFYADDSMVASSDPRWLQWDSATLVRLFDRVELKTNVGKTVSMTCRPCPAARNQSEEVYGRLMTGEKLTYLERKRERVECRDCRKDMAAGSLNTHCMSQHGKIK